MARDQEKWPQFKHQRLQRASRGRLINLLFLMPRGEIQKLLSCSSFSFGHTGIGWIAVNCSFSIFSKQRLLVKTNHKRDVCLNY